ncbi:DnaJ like subfamily B member 14 [Glycine soja]|uniref:DnaJ like subfamily B member 14 n=1 Tax=Glycine soja TaxID=3848 RepID=A0A0B2R2G6_GLYSO|nr:DnaJ like subfamily B member 14 [Glycine soja]
MECNKDEATRAKEIAERKFAAKDTLGAKKFALKALNLFPDLEGISQMVATLDVYIAAENKTNGEADWYGVLGVDPLADEDTVRRQYRKLALQLHPDKNKSIGADGAFKLISEAWSLLSDKAKRASYDKRSGRDRKVSTKFGGPSSQKGTNGSFNFLKTAPSRATPQKNTAKDHTSSSTYKSKSNTFWTVCRRCKMQYEYLRVYLNLKLLCPNCHEAFVAVETAPPPASGIRPATQWSFSQKQNSSRQPNKSKSNAGKNNMAAPNVGGGSCSKTDSYEKANFQWAPFSKISGVSNVAQAASVVQQAYDKVKRDREEAQAARKREEALKRKQHASKKGYYNPSKRRRGGMEDASASNHGKETNSFRSKQGNFEYNRVNGISKTGHVGDISPVQLKNLLMEKARKEISNKLRQVQSNAVDKTAMKENGNDFQEVSEKGEKCSRNSEMCAQDNIEKSEDRKSGSRAIKPFAGSTIAKVSRKFLETTPVDVLYPDFHDFCKDRTEGSFGENQVWAVYDNDDGMPRCYVLIRRIISLNPFKMQISWLNPNTNSELGPLKWVASGFSKICGDFRTSRPEICGSTNFFSHKVRWRTGAEGAICIYPRKGDVWAIYRNWSPDWNELTADEVIHKFDVVEVLEDFIEGHGIDVIPLVKVAGFRTVFHHHLDPKEIRIIPREEMFRFSHQIPSYVLTGQEAPEAPKGCRVLDPAATPFELLQVIEVVKKENVADDEDSDVKKTSDNMKKDNDEEMIDAMGKHGEEKEAKDEDMQEVEPSDNMKKGNEEMTNDTGRLREEKEGKDKDMQEVETLKEDKEREDLQ